MKVLQLSTDDFSGGASRAAYRLHTACLQNGVDSTMRVLRHQTANDRVIEGRSSRSFQEKVYGRVSQKLREFKNRNWRTNNLIMHSFGHASAGLVPELNACESDVLNLHWVVNLLSIEDIGKLTKPIVWTLHDMWAFCGGEHVAPDTPDSRFRLGYLANNRPAGEQGSDLNRLAWEAKRQAWARQQFDIVTPGRWMACCARESLLFCDMAIHVIPNPLEMQHLWRPIDKKFARAVLGLEQSKTYLLSGSAGGMPQLKGEDLLKKALQQLSQNLQPSVELLVFGQKQPLHAEDWSMPVHWLGSVKDDHVMALIYSAADVMLVSSRQDNLPNTAVEAHACGTPVVAFDIGGLPDIVTHQTTGWLAPAFDTVDYAQGIMWVLQDADRHAKLALAARQSAVDRFSPDVIVSQYLSVYEQALRR
jgi:glycosyltransferase involved in cell wall biosynthesis